MVDFVSRSSRRRDEDRAAGTESTARSDGSSVTSGQQLDQTGQPRWGLAATGRLREFVCNFGCDTTAETAPVAPTGRECVRTVFLLARCSAICSSSGSAATRCTSASFGHTFACATHTRTYATPSNQQLRHAIVRKLHPLSGFEPRPLRHIECVRSPIRSLAQVLMSVLLSRGGRLRLFDGLASQRHCRVG